MANTKATEVYTVEHFKLMDGTEVEVRPLAIKRLRQAQRKINAVFEKMREDAENADKYDEELEDNLLDIVEWVMRGQDNCKKFLDPDNGRELLEDTLDQHTLYEVIRVSTGYDFLATAQKAQEALKEAMDQT